MIKIIFLLTLIYFTNCTECDNYLNPKNAKECIPLQADVNRMCCLYITKCSNEELKSCTQFDKNEDIKTTIQELESAGKDSCGDLKIDIICHEDEVNNSFYLKIGILLILGLLF